MNEVTNQSLQPATVRASVVSSKPNANSVEKNGKEFPQESNSQGAVVESLQGPKSTDSLEQQRVNLDAAIAQMNEYTQATQRDIQFNVDETLGRTVISVIDRASQEVIRQIPDETFLKMARTLKENLANGNNEPLHLISARA